MRRNYYYFVASLPSIFFEKNNRLLAVVYDYSQGQLEIARQLTADQEDEDWALITKDEKMLHGFYQQILSTFKFIK